MKDDEIIPLAWRIVRAIDRRFGHVFLYDERQELFGYAMLGIAEGLNHAKTAPVRDLGGFLFGCGRRRCIGYIRRVFNKADCLPLLDKAALCEPLKTASHNYDLTQLRKPLRLTLLEETILHFRLCNWSRSEIAEELNLSFEEVHVALQRIRMRMQRRLSAKGVISNV